ncbi:MAG: molybdate ABC transporter substrate-binding protein [Sulfurospirillaceae bacterium]|nr:molybdate ABC transporter substrate-binding protein [Sulfurospirillaceae bacterium]
MFKIAMAILSLSVCLVAGEIRLAVAANMSDAIEVLKKEFTKSNPDTKISVILGSSGKLTAQIKTGAPYDVFLSADMMLPQKLYEENIAITAPVVYAKGVLALLSTKTFDFSKGIAVVQDASILKIALANPKTAPYGTATLEALKNANLYDSVSSKLVYAESISQAVQYATTVVDIGFVAKSSLYSNKMTQYKKGVHWEDVDTKLYTPISQGVVMLKNGEKNAEAKAFYEFILSQNAKKIFNDFGYITQ